MSDITRLSTAVTPAQSQTGKPKAAPKGYQDSFDVVLRASVLNEKDSPATQASLKRLDQALASDQPLRADVPRGYYLNIRI